MIGIFFKMFLLCSFFDKILLVFLIISIFLCVFMFLVFVLNLIRSLPVQIYDILETTYFWLKIAFRQFFWWKFKTSNEWIPIKKFLYDSLFSKESILREKRKQRFILRFIRYFYLFFFLSFRFCISYIWHWIVNGYFSTILLPFFFSFFFFFFFFKSKIAGFFYKMFWRLTVLFKTSYFAAKNMDQFYVFITYFFGLFYRGIKYNIKYKTSTIFVEPYSEMYADEVPVPWNGVITNRVLYFASLFRPLNKGFLLKFDPEFKKFNFFGLVSWIFVRFLFFFIYGIVYVFTVLFFFFSWISFINFFFISKFLKILLFLDTFTFFRFLKSIILKFLLFFFFCLRNFSKLCKFVNFIFIFYGFIVFLKWFLNIIFIILRFFLKIIFKLRFFLFLFFCFLYFGPINFFWFFFSWIALVTDYWVSLFITPFVEHYSYGAFWHVLCAKCDAIKVAKSFLATSEYWDNAFQSFYNVWRNFYKWKEKIFTIHFFLAYYRLKWKYWFLNLFPIESIVYWFKIYDLLFLMLLDFIFVEAPSNWILYILNFFGFFDSKFFNILYYIFWFLWHYFKIFLTINCHRLIHYFNEFINIWLSFSLFLPEDIRDYFKNSNLILLLRWFFFYSFFDFFNKSFFLNFFTIFIKSTSNLMFYLSIFYDSFFFISDIFLYCWIKILDLLNFLPMHFFYDFKMGFYWFYYFWIKIQAFLDTLHVDFRVKAWRIDHIAMRTELFLIHPNEFLLRTCSANIFPSIFNLYTPPYKGNGYSDIFLFARYTSYFLHVKVPLKHLAFGLQYALLDNSILFLIFLFSLLGFLPVLYIFSGVDPVWANVNFCWRKFKALSINEVFRYLTEVPEYVKKKVIASTKIGENRYKEWEFWWFPLAVIRSLGRGHIDAVVEDKILQEGEIGKRLVLKYNFNSLKGKEDKGGLKKKFMYLLGRRSFGNLGSMYMKAKESLRSKSNVISFDDKLIYETHFMEVGSKIFGSDMIRSFNGMDYDFFYYYMNDDEYAEYYDAFKHDYNRLSYFIAYSYNRQKSLRYLHDLDSEIIRLATESNPLAKEKAFYVETLFNYFFNLDKDLFGFRLPHWSFHRDLEMHLPVLSVMAKGKSKAKMKELYWLTDNDPTMADNIVWWIWLVPLAFLYMRGQILDFDPIWNMLCYYDVKLLFSSTYTSFEWVHFIFDNMGYGAFNVFDEVQVPNSPHFRSYYLHADYDIIQKKIDHGYKWYNQMVIGYREADVYASDFLATIKADCTHLARELWLTWGYHSDTLDAFTIYKIPLAIIYLIFLTWTIKNITKKRKVIFKSLKTRLFSLKQLHNLRLYFFLKKNLRNGFLWFWR